MSATARTTAHPMRCVKLTLPPAGDRARWLFTIRRLTSRSLAGTSRNEVAVGTSRLASMLVTIRAPAPRMTSPGGWVVAAGGWVVAAGGSVVAAGGPGGPSNGCVAVGLARSGGGDRVVLGARGPHECEDEQERDKAVAHGTLRGR